MKVHCTRALLLPLLFTGLFPWPGRSQDAQTPYESAMRAWHERRIASLTSPTSWLSLAGLYWLKEGENTFGSADTNDLVFPRDRAAAVLGSFRLKSGVVTVRIEPGAEVWQDSVRISEAVLRTDADGSPTILRHGSLSWFVIKRGERFAIRLRDAENPRIAAFKGIERYPIDSSWRIPARLVPYNPPRTISVPNIIGTVDEEPCPGALVFSVGGAEFRLDPIAEAGSRQLFIVFGDETNGPETYGGGRFVYAEPPGPDSMTVIDFNKAYNPPCAFTEFATCPLPPQQNRLPIPVTAGEKKYEGFEH